MLGVATSGATLFRSIGGSLGTAVLGAIFSGRLTSELPTGAASSGGLDPSAIHRLPAAQRDVFINAFTDALQLVFLVATVVVLVAFVAVVADPGAAAAQDGRDRPSATSLGGPVDTDSMREVTRALSIAVGRERTLAFLADTVAPRGRRPLPGRLVGAAAARGARRALGREPGRAPARPQRPPGWPRSRSCASAA